MSKGKKPKISSTFSYEMSPKTEKRADKAWSSKVCWSFSRMAGLRDDETVKKWIICAKTLGSENSGDILGSNLFSRLVEKESKTWAEVFMAGSHMNKHGGGSNNHEISLARSKDENAFAKDKFHDDAVPYLKQLFDKGYKQIFEIRFTGKERLYGVLEHNRFEIIWWDPEHEICFSSH